MRATRIVLIIGTVALLIWALAMIMPTNRHPAPGYLVRDCKAALRLIATEQGTIPRKPAECDPLTPRQYDGAVADVTRAVRIKP